MDLAAILARVEHRLKALGLSADAASKMAGKTDAIRNLRRAVADGDGRKGISTATITALAPALQTTGGWLLQGEGPEQLSRPKVRVVGYAGAGARTHFYALPEASLDEVDRPAGATERTVAIEIRGDSLGTIFDRWYAFFDDVRSPVTDDLLGQLCVVGLSDESVLIKKLRRGRRPGTYRLLSENEDPIEDAQVSWAARVISLSPR